MSFKYYNERTGQYEVLTVPTLKGERGERGEPGAPGAKGEAGVTPNLTIGTVVTLEPEREASVAIRGTKENPVLDFGIPRGKDGTSSQVGNSFDDSTISTEKTWSSAKIENFVHANDEVVWTDVSGEIANIDYAKEGYLREVEVWGNTIQDKEDLSNIRHLGELHVDDNGEPILDNLGRKQYKIEIATSETLNLLPTKCDLMPQPIVKVHLEAGEKYTIFSDINTRFQLRYFDVSDTSKIDNLAYWASVELPYNSEGKVFTFTVEKSWFKNADYFLIRNYWLNGNLSTEELFKKAKARMFKGTVDLYSNTQEHKALTYEDIYVNPKVSKTTLLLPCQLAKVDNVADRLYWDSKKERYIIEKNTLRFSAVNVTRGINENGGCINLYRVNGVQAKANTVIVDSNIYIGDRGSDWVNLKVNSDFYYGNGYGLTEADAKRFLKDYPVNIICATSKTNELVDTEIREELKLPIFIKKAYVRVTGGIDGAVKAKAPINGGQVILDLSQKNTLLERENAEIKAINEAQDAEIELNQRAINFMLFAPTTESLKEDKESISAMAVYLANQILKGRLDYHLVISRYVEFKEDIDSILISEGKQEIIQ